jgi:acyl dehydratase
VRVREARRSRSKPDRGLVGFDVEVMNQDREVVMTLQTVGFYLCRERA